MRTVVVYRAKRVNSDSGQDRVFLVWKLVTESGIGFEEIHFSTVDGDPTDPGQYTELGFEFQVHVSPEYAGDPRPVV